MTGLKASTFCSFTSFAYNEDPANGNDKLKTKNRLGQGHPGLHRKVSLVITLVSFQVVSIQISEMPGRWAMEASSTLFCFDQWQQCFPWRNISENVDVISSGPAAVFCLGEIFARIFDVIFFWRTSGYFWMWFFLEQWQNLFLTPPFVRIVHIERPFEDRHLGCWSVYSPWPSRTCRVFEISYVKKVGKQVLQPGRMAPQSMLKALEPPKLPSSLNGVGMDKRKCVWPCSSSFLGRTTCPRHLQDTIAVMSLASDTRREAMLCSAVLVLPWCCTVILIQNMNLDRSIRVYQSIMMSSSCELALSNTQTSCRHSMLTPRLPLKLCLSRWHLRAPHNRVQPMDPMAPEPKDMTCLMHYLSCRS